MYVAVRKGGEGLTYGDSPNSSGNDNDACFFVQVLVGTTHGGTQYSVNKQTNKIFNLTLS